MSAPLYNAEILRLAATIPHHERLSEPMATAEKRSPICGSRVTIDVAVDDAGRVSEVGLLVRACALGFGFGALKGLILASLVFLLATLVIDTMGGGPSRRPGWMTTSRTYPLLNATSASIADFVDRRRRGKPVFGANTPPSRSDNASEPKS